MAQQSARRGRKNQMYSSCLEHAFMIWFRSANSHMGPQLHRCIRGRTDGSIRLRANLLQNRLHLVGRPQMSTGTHQVGAALYGAGARAGRMSGDEISWSDALRRTYSGPSPIWVGGGY